MCARTCAHTCSFAVLFQGAYTHVCVFKLCLSALLVLLPKPPPPLPPLTLTSSSPSREPRRLDEGEQRLFFLMCLFPFKLHELVIVLRL